MIERRIGLVGWIASVVAGFVIPVAFYEAISYLGELGLSVVMALLSLACAMMVFFSERRASRRLLIALAYVGTFAMMIGLAPLRRRWSLQWYLTHHESELMALTQTMQRYGRDESINPLLPISSDSERPWTRWFSGQELDLFFRRSPHLAEERAQYHRRLEDLGFIQIELIDDTVYFTKGGLIDNCAGVAYAPGGGHPPLNSCGYIAGWTMIRPNWYAWTTN